MPLILRKLDKKASFYAQEWLEDDDVQADALSSLRTKDNQLSVWLIDDDRSNLNRVIAALASGRDHLDKVDYALIDRRFIDSLDIQVSKVDGRSPDMGANQHWHCDLARLSGKQLLALALGMRKGLVVREPKSKVRTAILESIDSGVVAKNAIKITLLESLR